MFKKVSDDKINILTTPKNNFLPKQQLYRSLAAAEKFHRLLSS